MYNSTWIKRLIFTPNLKTIITKRAIDMSKEFIKGIIYSRFDQKAGPKPIVWIPQINEKTLDLVSTKSINLLSGEQKIPESLAIIPFPSINQKGCVKFFETIDNSLRGKSAESALTLLFDEAEDLIFYKYMKHFESAFNKTAHIIMEYQEKKVDFKKIMKEIEHFKERILELLEELRHEEMAAGESDAFPAPEDQEIREARWKLIVCGDPAVGKTSTILRYTNNAFRKTYLPTIGTNLSKKRIKYKDADIQFVLWDIAGQAAGLPRDADRPRSRPGRPRPARGKAAGHRADGRRGPRGGRGRRSVDHGQLRQAAAGAEEKGQ